MKPGHEAPKSCNSRVSGGNAEKHSKKFRLTGREPHLTPLLVRDRGKKWFHPTKTSIYTL